MAKSNKEITSLQEGLNQGLQEFNNSDYSDKKEVLQYAYQHTLIIAILEVAAQLAANREFEEKRAVDHYDKFGL